MLKMRNRRWCKKNNRVCHKFQFHREHQGKKIPLPTAKSCHKSYILELGWGIGRQNPIPVSGKCNLWQQLQQNRNPVSGEAITATKPSKPSSFELKLPLPFLPCSWHSRHLKKPTSFPAPVRHWLNRENLKCKCLPGCSPSEPYGEKTALRGGLAELYSLTWTFFFSMWNSLILFSDCT